MSGSKTTVLITDVKKKKGQREKHKGQRDRKKTKRKKKGRTIALNAPRGLCKSYLPVTRRYVASVYLAPPRGRSQVNISHTPSGQVNNLLIFHIGEVFSQTLQFIPKNSGGVVKQ